MPNILDILARAQSLMNETALNSITPPRAGGIMYDTLLVLNQMQLEGGSLLISKIYTSVSAMEADTTPTSDLTGRALRAGQLAVIVPADTSSADLGKVYRFNSAGSWSLCGKIGGLPFDTEPADGSTNGITSGAVYDVKQDLEREVSQLDLEVKENGFSAATYEKSTFTSQTPNITLTDADMLFSQVGDYIEVKVNAKGTNGYILRRQTSYNQPVVRYSSSNYLQVRFNSTANWTYQNDAVNWNTVQIIKILLTAITGTVYTYEIYLDGAKVGTQDAAAVAWNQIGYSSVMDLYYIKKKIGGVETTLTHFAEITGAVGVTDVDTYKSYEGLVNINDRVYVLEDLVAKLNGAVFGEDMYFLFIKSSPLYNLASHFLVLQRVKGTQNYIGTIIGYYTYSGGAGYPNGYWRMERTSLFTIIDGAVTTIQNQIITAGENEFVLKWLAGSGYNFSGGFSGGFHYGETIDNVPGAWVEFVADGHILDTSADIPITPCKSFYYREYSPIYQHNDDSIAAWHLKHTEIKDCGYETVNDVNFVQALDYFAYPGIVCVSRFLSEKAMPEDVATITDMGDGTGTAHNQFESNKHRIHYEGNGYITEVESEVLVGADDSQCVLSVYNGADYNKYYRRNPDTVGSTNNRLKGRTKVTISAI